MSSIIVAGLCSGALAGAVMIFLSHIAPWFAKGSWVKNLEDPKALGKEINKPLPRGCLESLESIIDLNLMLELR